MKAGRALMRRMSSGLSIKMIPDPLPIAEEVVEEAEEVHLSKEDAFRLEQDNKDLRDVFNNAFDRDSDQRECAVGISDEFPAASPPQTAIAIAEISSTEFVETMRVSIGLKLDKYDILDLFDEVQRRLHRPSTAPPRSSPSIASPHSLSVSTPRASAIVTGPNSRAHCTEAVVCLVVVLLQLLTDHHRGISLVEFRVLMTKNEVCKIRSKPLDPAMICEALQNLFDPHSEGIVGTPAVERGMNCIGWLLRPAELECMYSVAGPSLIDNQIELTRFSDQVCAGGTNSALFRSCAAA